MSRAEIPPPDFKLLFERLDEDIRAFDNDLKIQFHETQQISEEVEALRAITEQVNAAASGIHLLTFG